MSVVFRPSIPTAMLAALTLVAVLEWFAFRPRIDLAGFIPASWIEASRASHIEAVDAEILFLGDSQIKGSLIPAAFDDRLPLLSYNLAVIGGQPAAALALLEKAIETGARPRAIVIGFYPGLLGADSRINVRQWPELFGINGCIQMLWRNRDFNFAGPLLLRSLLPSLRRREEIQAAFLTLGKDKGWAGSLKTRGYRRNWRINKGAQILAVNPAFRDDPGLPIGEPGAVSNLAGAGWRAKAEHLVHIRKLLTLAESRGISIFWLLPTNSPGLRTFRQNIGLDAAYFKTIQELQVEFPALCVLDPSSLLTETTAFSDPCHLDRNGAHNISVSVVEAIRRRILKPKDAEMQQLQWVILSNPEPGTRIAPTRLYEDVDSSIRKIATKDRPKKVLR